MDQAKSEKSFAPRILAALAALALSSCASHSTKAAAPQPAPMAASAPAPNQPPPAPKTDSTKMLPVSKLWAVVQSVDLGARQLVVKDRHGGTHIVSVAADAEFTKGGDNEAVTLSDIKAGDRLTFKLSGDIASSVHLNVVASK